MLNKIVRSLLLVFGVSIVAAWPLYYVGINPISSFLFCTVLQFVGFFFYNEYVARKLAIEEQRLVVAREAELSKQGAEVTCPCDKNAKCFVPIILSARNEYVCPGCNKDINVLVNLKTVLVTTPVAEGPTETIIRHVA